MEARVLNCDCCGLDLILNIDVFVNHAQKHFKANDTVSCPVCNKNQSLFKNFKRHLKTHISVFSENSISTEINIDLNQNVELNQEENIATVQKVTELDCVKDLWKIAIETSARHSITKVGVRSLLTEFVPFFRDCFTNKEFNIEYLADQMVKSVSSVTQQNNAVELFPTYVRPLEIDLKESTHFFIKPSETLQAMMKNKRIVSSIMKNRRYEEQFDKKFDKVFWHRKDGELFKDDPNDELHITIFSDDANFSSAMSRNKKHKLFAMTMQVDEVGYEISKSVKEMDLVLISYTEFITKEDALKMCIRAVVEDMKHLEKQKLILIHNGREHKFTPKIKSVCGDNLAKAFLLQLNQVGYLIQCFVSNIRSEFQPRISLPILSRNNR